MQEKREKNPKTQAQREKMFLYFTMRWAKTQVSCGFLAFCSCFAHKPYQNANPTHNVIWALLCGGARRITQYEGVAVVEVVNYHDVMLVLVTAGFQREYNSHDLYSDMSLMSILILKPGT